MKFGIFSTGSTAARPTFLLAALVLLASLLALSGCGSSGSSSSSSSTSSTSSEGGAGSEGGEATTAAETESEGTLVPAPPTVPPTEIAITEPLPGTPPKGKEVVFLQCEVASCERFSGAIEEAAEAIGWKARIMPLNNSDPGSSLSSAIAQKPDYIAMTGIPAAAMKPQLAEAAAKGIPVVSCGTTDPASPKGYQMECDGTLQPTAEYLGAWITNHSEGKAKVLGVSIPQFPALVSETEWLGSPGFEQMCPECGYEELAVTVEDLAQGVVGQKVIAYMQANPGIDYLYFTLGDLTIGVPEALKATGGEIGEATIVAALEDPFTIEGVIKGDVAATTPTPNEYMSWVMIDGLARISLEGKLSPEYQKNVYENIAVWVIDNPKAAESLPDNVWPGPENFQAQFKKLWGVS